jgi:basic membrane protein A and related proteins
MYRKLLPATVLIVLMALLVACAPAPAAQPAQANQPADAAAQPTNAPTAGAQPAASGAAPWKACWIYNSPVGDMGWAFSADQGRKYVEKKYGIQTAIVESVPGGADAERVLAQLAEEGCNQIFTTSTQYADPAQKVAPKYPKVLFEVYEGFQTLPNLRIHRTRMDEAYYLAGILSGKMSKAGQMGWVSGFSVPPFMAQANSMILGARTVNPDFKVKLVFMNKWSDPPGEKQASESLAAAGADVLSNAMSSPTVLQSAEGKGVYSLGRTEQCTFAPKGCLGSIVIKWDNLYDHLISTARDGKFQPEVFWANLATDGVGITQLNPAIPADVLNQVEKARKDIASGDLVIYMGPIKDQSGAVKLADGQTLTSDQVNTMDWYAEGVQTPSK